MFSKPRGVVVSVLIQPGGIKIFDMNMLSLPIGQR